MPERLGWVLIHRKVVGKATSAKEFESEDDLEMWLDRVSRSDRRWHWKRSHPMKPDGPHTLLFGFDGGIWGSVRAKVTNEMSPRVSKKDFNFAFQFLERPDVLRKRGKSPIPLKAIVGNHLALHHRDLIVLKQNMLTRYNGVS